MSDNDLTLDDLEKVVPILRWIMTIIGLVIVIMIAFSGYKSWPWYIAIPLGGGLFLGTKILKRMFSNTGETMRTELLEDGVISDGLSVTETKFEDFVDLSDIDKSRVSAISDLKIAQKRESSALSFNVIIIAIIAMLLVGAFWYGLGRLLAVLF